MALSVAERLLISLGVERPEEIDLEAIAWYLGVVSVKRRELDGCDARIVGKGNRAIISVDPKQMYRRQRFSIAHELGHWVFHRGRTSFCRSDDIGEQRGAPGEERSANTFAADLLLPGFLLAPIGRQYPKLTVQAIREMADRFDATMSATAIRLIELGHSPAMVVCYGKSGRRWFARSPLVPRRWFPESDLHRDTYAFDVLRGISGEQASPRRIPADAFFDQADADRFEVEEQSFKVSDSEIITVIFFQNDQMLEE